MSQVSIPSLTLTKSIGHCKSPTERLVMIVKNEAEIHGYRKSGYSYLHSTSRLIVLVNVESQTTGSCKPHVEPEV